jgi:hypothetical protein
MNLLESSGISGSLSTGNDILLGDRKIFGCVRPEYTNGISVMTGFLSFAMDTNILKPAIKDEAVWQRIGSVHNNGFTLTGESISDQFIKSFKTIFEKDLTSDNLNNSEKSIFMEV